MFGLRFRGPGSSEPPVVMPSQVPLDPRYAAAFHRWMTKYRYYRWDAQGKWALAIAAAEAVLEEAKAAEETNDE